MQSLPNFSKKIDNSIDLIDFVSHLDGKIEASIIRLSCHRVSSPANIKGADYIGYLKKI